MLIIIAHPREEFSFCRAALKFVIEELDKKKKSYEIIDLYKMGFNPVMSAEEHYTAGGDKISEEVREIQSKMRKHSEYLFIFPTWWNTFPAMFKGFLDKVFIPNFAFKYANGIPVGLLDDKKAYVLTTRADDYMNSLTNGNETGLKTFLKGVLEFCGISHSYIALQNCRQYSPDRNDMIHKNVLKLLDGKPMESKQTF